MKIVKLSKENGDQVVHQAQAVLQKGGLVVYPTETCYGLGADVENQEAINKLFQYKRRREGKPLSVLVADKKMAERYVELNESAYRLYKRFLPGPMTVVSKSKHVVVPGVASEMGTLGIRISSHPFALALAKAYGKGITATSANASWQKKPYSLEDILKPLTAKQKEKLDLLIDAGQLPKHKASTVVDTTLVETMVVRQGELNLDERSKSLISNSEHNTKELAKRLVLKHWNQMRKQGLVFGLVGDLGTGKTTFTQGIGEYLHLSEKVVSPSYTLVNEYPFSYHNVNGILYHLDPWRLESFLDMQKLGFDTMLGPNKIVVIEWSNKFMNQIETEVEKRGVQFIKVVIEDLGNQQRRIMFSD